MIRFSASQSDFRYFSVSAMKFANSSMFSNVIGCFFPFPNLFLLFNRSKRSFILRIKSVVAALSSNPENLRAHKKFMAEATEQLRVWAAFSLSSCDFAI